MRRALAALALAASIAFPAAAEDRLRIVASFTILADFAREVGGDAVEVATLVGPDQDAHVYEPTPSDARALAAATLVVVNGLGFEGWLTRLVRASGFKGPTVTASAGIRTIGRVPDPHVWQDPRRAQAMVRNIAAGLAGVDPARAELYRRNADAYVAKLAGIEAEVTAALASVPADRRKVITSHDAFGYFTDRFGIAFAAPRGVGTESEPSAADVARIIRVVRRENVRIVFMENVTDPKLIERIAREGGARLGGRLYSDALSRADGPAATYLAMMRHNAALMREAMLAR